MITEKSLAFLSENAFRNDREWYERNKEVYREYVVAPLAAMVTELSRVMFEIDPMLICSPKVGGSISRVRRDTRFTRDKSLYRDNAWIVFYTDKKTNACAPSFFFEFSEQGWDYGCGWYSTEPFIMQNIREMVLSRDPVFVKAEKAFVRQSVFELEGDSYRRTKYPDAPPEMRFWLDRRHMCFVRYGTDREFLFSENLAEKLGEDYLILKPMYEMMKKAAYTK